MGHLHKSDMLCGGDFSLRFIERFCFRFDIIFSTLDNHRLSFLTTNSCWTDCFYCATIFSYSCKTNDRRNWTYRKNKFSYKDIKTVYTIVLYENSPKEFHPYKDIFIYRAEQVVDSGVKLNLLQKYTFLPLDIFKETHHNKPIENKLEAWLIFFTPVTKNYMSYAGIRGKWWKF